MIKKIIILTLFLGIPSLIGFVSADTYKSYYEDAVVPTPEKLDVKNNLLIDLFSGAVVYKYPLDIPPGTNGLQPSIYLAYNSHSMTNRPSILGSGWSISESYIQINTNSTFGNQSDDSFILVLNGVPYDLVNSTDGGYHTKVESFFFINKTTGGSNRNGKYWILITPDGTSYRFGYYNFSEILSNTYNYVWRWNLDLIKDTYNNSIYYNYTINPFPLDKGVAYLDKIQYNNDKERSVNFFYDLNNTLDLRKVYDNGNLISISRRLKDIYINVSDKTVRRYSFNYSRLENEATISSLSNITEYGNDSSTLLKPVVFQYNPIGSLYQFINFSFDGCNSVNSTGCINGPNGEDYGVRFVDINGDGLVDIVKAYNAVTYAWLNNGTGWQYTNWSHGGCNPIYSPGCFAASNLDIGTRLVDLNGDSLVDVIRADASASNTYWTFMNNGTGWGDLSYEWTFPSCHGGAGSDDRACFIDQNGHDSGVRLVDINGDSLADLLKAKYTGSTSESMMWINNGYGFFDTNNFSFDGCNSVNNTGCFVGPNGEDYGVRLVDINGDGLVDIVRAYNAITYAWLNNGTGWQYTNWSHSGCNPSYTPGCFAASNLDIGTRLIDINGDSLVDVIRGDASAGPSYWIFMNNGTGWGDLSYEWTVPSCHGGIGSNGNGCFVNSPSSRANPVDINGDGLADIFRAEASVPPALPVIGSWVNNGPSSYLIKVIDSSLGGKTLISYQKSTSLDNTGDDDAPDLSFNIWVVSNITKYNNIPGAQNLTSTLYYNFSNGIYNLTAREFRGFNLAEEKVNNTKTRHWFHQDEGRMGKEYKTEIFDNQGSPYKNTENDWNLTYLNRHYIASLAQDSESNYDGVQSNPKVKNNTYSYDSFGNVVYKHIKGDIADNRDDSYEYISYVNNTDKWIVNTIKEYKILAQDNSTILRQSKYSYDGLAYGASPEKGSVTFKEDILVGGSDKNISFQYNAFGNVVNQTDSKGNKVNYSYGASDPTNTFADSKTSPKGFKTKYGYHLGTGNLLNQTSSNSFISNFAYDQLAIDKNKVLPLDNSDYPTQEYSYSFKTIGDSKIIVKQREQTGASNTLDTYKFYDGFGRLIQTKTEATAGKQIVVDYYYDDSSRLIKQSNPYFVAFTQNYSSADTSIPFTLYQYDALDRVVKVFNPDNSVKSIVFDRWNVTSYDENSNRVGYELDFRGNIVRVIEYNGSGTYPTSYAYNSAGELIFINDSLTNTINYTYDSLGRKVQEKDPDRGIWNYTYDSEGNLLRQTDGRNASINFTYDSLNRKINETSNQYYINYTYDSDLNETLSRVVTNYAEINYSYDSRLRKTEEKKSLSNKTYSGSWAYDSADRVISQVLPDGKLISFTYNEGGLLSNISRLTDISYNPNNNPVSINYSNNLVTQYSYNTSNLRLTEIKTSNKQELDYQYDPVGNVLDINDEVHNVSYIMSYDSLNRLVGTTISGSFNVMFDFIYDQIGNIRNVTGDYAADYYYEDSRPHATSRVVFY